MMKLKLNITPGQAVAYATLPRIIPRLQDIGFHFKFVAYMMAILYAGVGLLKPGHPFLNPNNIGTYSARQVFIEAAFNLKFRLKNIDQIVIFFLLLAAFVLLMLQFGLMILYLITGIAHAAAFASFFSTNAPADDIAFILLDRVFGVPGFFNSCISDLTTTCTSTGKLLVPPEPTVFPEPHQLAMQAFFAFYSIGMLMVGAVIVCYFILATFFESVQSGVPFGRRFASIYAPIRLCLAILMLIPLPLGGGSSPNMDAYNGAQYLTLFAARAGSSFATNTWNIFNNYFSSGGAGVAAPAAGQGMLSVNQPTTGTAASQLIAIPKAASIDPLLRFMHIAHACRAMFARSEGRTIDAFQVRPLNIAGGGTYAPLTLSTTFADALTFSDNGTILIRFGMPTPNLDEVRQYCGEVAIPVNDLNQPGSRYMYEQNFLLIAQMWNDSTIIGFGNRIAAIITPASNGEGCDVTITPAAASTAWGPGATDCNQFPKPAFYIDSRNLYQGLVDANLVTARNNQIASASSAIDPAILARGWAGAGIWYNQLARLNGSLFDAAHSLPVVRAMPMPMLSVMMERGLAAVQTTAGSKYTPPSHGDATLTTRYKQISQNLNQVYKYFLSDAFNRSVGDGKTGGAIFDLMNFLFGTEALFEMRANSDINPLVQLVAMGKSIVDRAVINLLGATGLEFAGGVLSQLDDWSRVGKGILKVSDAWFTVTTLALGVGIMMYYVLPFLPFIYFFFSVIKWLQSIFEAMIGMPLWALAHIRIDGDGLPGPAAANGYYLIFEIFLRPVLTIFGMIASFIIFTAMVFTLNDVFQLLSVNTTGFNQVVTKGVQDNLVLSRGSVDEFFFTIMYAVLVYIIALSSFKLIDMIPANILRWMGTGVRNIVDDMGDSIPNLIRTSYIGAFGIPLVQKGGEGAVGSAIEGVQGAAQGLGQMAGATIQQGINAAKNQP